MNFLQNAAKALTSDDVDYQYGDLKLGLQGRNISLKAFLVWCLPGCVMVPFQSTPCGHSSITSSILALQIKESQDLIWRLIFSTKDFLLMNRVLVRTLTG